MAEPVGRRRVASRPFVAYQHLDYLRAFFNNRLAWSRFHFMLCAVGAFQIGETAAARGIGVQGLACQRQGPARREEEKEGQAGGRA